MSAQSSNGVSHQNYCTTTSQKGQLDKSVNGKLTQKHFDYLTKERGIPEQWVLANFESLTAKEAREMGFTAPSDGILLKSSLPGLQFQFRPDEPTVKTQPNGKQRVIKYLTPAKGEVDAMLPKHPLWEHEYWEDIEILEMYCWEIDGEPHIILTEGFIDALIATEKGLPTIALTGVENGLTGSKRDTESKRYLVPVLRRYA